MVRQLCLPRVVHVLATTLLLVAGLAGVPLLASAQCLDYSVSGSQPEGQIFDLFPEGSVQDLVMDGNIGWVGRTNYGALVSVDFTDPDHPVLLGTEAVEVMDEVYDVDVEGDLGFLTYLQWGGEAGVRVFDITDPSDPTDIGSFLMPGTWASYLAASDSLVYVSFSYTTFGILDVSDGSAPVLIGQVPVYKPWEITLAGDLAYVATEVRPVIINISDPTAPEIIGTIPTAAIPNKISIEGNLAYVATDGGLEIFDVTDPTSPQPVSAVSTAPYATYVDVADGLAYVMVRNTGVHLFDMQDPAAPQLHAVIEFPTVQWGMAKAQAGRLHVIGEGRLNVIPLQCPLYSSAVEPLPPVDDVRLLASPNPFNPGTTIRFETTQRQSVILAIYSVDGRRVRTLVEGIRDAGPQEAYWDGRDQNGNSAASGTYLARLRAGESLRTVNLVLIK